MQQLRELGAAQPLELNQFKLLDLYPTAQSVFSVGQTLAEVRDQCVVVLDTNVLLVPYSIGPQTLSEIERTYDGLVKQGRLVVPGQVAREFAVHRQTKLCELHQQLTSKKRVKQFSYGRYPLLESIPEYAETLKIEKELDALVSKYTTAMDGVIAHVRNWSWNDPVSILYGRILSTGVVFDPELDRDAVAEDAKRRQAFNIPPGFNDESIGDIIIWHTILNLGKQRKSPLVFVSRDVKNDWFSRSEGGPLFPRYELVAEYHGASGGQAFHIVSLSDLLQLFGADEEAVTEVRDEEEIAATVPAEQFTFEQVKNRVINWLERAIGTKWKTASYPGPHPADALIILDDGKKLAVRVVYPLSPKSFVTQIRDACSQCDALCSAGVIDAACVVAVAPSVRAAEAVYDTVAARLRNTITSDLVIGNINDRQDFTALLAGRFVWDHVLAKLAQGEDSN